MKKLTFNAVILAILILAACGDTSEENLGGSVVDKESTETEGNTSGSDNDNSKDEGGKDQTHDINKVIVDNEHYKATLIKIVKKEDELWGKSYEVVFDIENRRSDSIEVQAREVSADGRMIDDTLLSMSDEIAPGKKGYATLSISEFEGYEFPEITSDFEMLLHVFSWDDYDWSEDSRVQVSF